MTSLTRYSPSRIDEYYTHQPKATALGHSGFVAQPSHLSLKLISTIIPSLSGLGTARNGEVAKYTLPGESPPSLR